MKYSYIEALALTVILTVTCFFNAANASLISYNGYTLDTDTDIVTGGGLEWLQWDVTVGESISSAIDSNGIFNGLNYGAGWTLASNLQMATLFDSFGFNSTANESLFSSTEAPYTVGVDDSPVDFFIQMFGTTEFVDDPQLSTGIDGYDSTRAIYGADENGNGRYNLLSASSDHTRNYGSTLAPAFVFMYDDSILVPSNTYSNQIYGVALVRSISVSEPTTFAILALGLVGFGLRRKFRS